MNNYSIFYSWQSDTPRTCNREFIRKAIDNAVASLTQKPGVEYIPHIESDMEGIGGTPEVATVMFNRISRSAIFIGDMTIVGTIQKSNGEIKHVSNSNVLLEMGYAAGTLGWKRVICVMNEHFGGAIELPIDVRNRRFPITYKLSPEDTKQEEKTQRKLAKLTKEIQFAIEAVENEEYEAVNKAISALSVQCWDLIEAYGQGDHFPAPDTRKTSIGGKFDSSNFNLGVNRLLDLGLIETQIRPDLQ